MTSSRRLFGLSLLLLVLSVAPAFAEVRETNLWWTPDAATKHAHRIDSLLHLIFYLTAGVFVATQTVFIYFLIKYRRKRGVPAYYSHGNNQLEIIWTTIPALIFLALGIYGNRMWFREVRSPAPADAIQIDIVAYQYGWHVRNPGLDGKLGKFSQQALTKDNFFGLESNDPAGDDDYQSENVLTVPLGKAVHLHLRSMDVIHAFYVPEFRMYQDTVPGRLISWVWFEATRLGNFELACSQLCGAGHYNMKAKVNVVTLEEYNKLVAEKSKAALDSKKTKAASLSAESPTAVASTR
ncbi:MAG: cytochrome c oxidase subunit II [Verrucomicrobia bacterium]|nr:cytochrome c oxidase subunit II [Verrucomicrobiota bacterium]